MKTIFLTDEAIERKWYLVDAADKPLGRVAAKAAAMLRGKHKPTFSPHQASGDYVVIINAEKVAVTGNKADDKLYHHHSGYVGGLKTVNFKSLVQKHPTQPLMLAIKGMLPNGPLGRKLLKNVKVYAGSEHPHLAQNPEKVEM